MPYKRLWFSVFKTAIEDFRGIHGPVLREDARSWLISDYEGIGSFIWICSVLDLEPFFIRSICHQDGDGPLPFLFGRPG